MRNILTFLVLALLFTACDDLFEPAIENNRTLEDMYKEPTYAQGIMANAYVLLPYQGAPTSDVATDDAVSNDNANNYLRMATGSWSANSNPMSQWQGRKNAIQYLNLFIANTDKVVWSNDKKISTMYNDRLTGEAYGLRAVHMYHLLLAHGGWSNGQLLGVPIVTEPETAKSDFNQPRNTFQECVDQILADADKAISLLPVDYADITTPEVPQKYVDLGVTNASDYNRVNGSHMKGRITGRIVEAIKAQVALLAASPAYSEGTTVTWENAANFAATVLNRIGGISGIDPKGGIWYEKDQVENLASGANPKEILWRSNISTDNNDLETDNFPPSVFGKGRVNPTQNLVDAFPAVNGYPISLQESNFDASNPYADRDPRLGKYIVVNESKMGPADNVIVTGTYGTTTDVINKESGYSTRTGYYLRKLLRPDANPDPKFDTNQKRYTARIRYTELFLIYAEAANEAWGPTTAGGSANFSAYDVVKQLRIRAGIKGGDAYLESIKGDKDKMRELIRNERRLELCFENMRFWDLRRWKVDLNKLNETALGMSIDKSGSVFTYNPVEVEPRKYSDYMYYGPIPYGETLKWNKLEQNTGW